MDKLEVTCKDLGKIGYKAAWDYQESLLQNNVALKTLRMQQERQHETVTAGDTSSYLLFCEHPPVYTLGKSGDISNVLISEEAMQLQGIEFFKTNRGGDITFHGPGQVVGYPILDLEKLYTDIGRYLRELEEVIILTLAEYGVKGERSKGETGVWIDAHDPVKARKICAMGVRCSRWITMHGLALNVNTDLDYFKQIIPCGIADKEVASLHKELGRTVDMQEVKQYIARHFEAVFNVTLTKID